MYEDEQRRVSNHINKLYSDGILTNRTIIMFGVSENIRQMIRMIECLGHRAACIIDNDPARKGSNCYQVPVKEVSDLTSEEVSNGVYFIYSYFWREMKSQLLELGIEEERIYSFFLTDRTLEEQFKMAERGKEICETFRDETGDYPIYLCPYTGTGDIYLIGTFWEEYLRRLEVKNYIFIVVSKACAKVAEIFDIPNVKQITQVESSYVVEFYKLCGDKTGIKILNDSWKELRANPLQRFRGFKGLYFTEIFRKFVFDLDDDVMPMQPRLKEAGAELDKIFRDNRLTAGHTVVLSPYSNTLSDLPANFWCEMVNAIKKRGFAVCTNCGEDEQPVESTTGVFIPLNIMPQFVERAGVFIGVRSGLCDCISAANAKKFILYDKKDRFFNCSAFEYFNLKNMGLCDDAVEIEYDTEHIEVFRKQILEALSFT